MKEVYLATDDADARLVQTLLLREGIESDVRESLSSGAPTVWVTDDEDELPARVLLAALLKQRTDPPPEHTG